LFFEVTCNDNSVINCEPPRVSMTRTSAPKSWKPTCPGGLLN
jgi:hypothetical protein